MHPVVPLPALALALALAAPPIAAQEAGDLAARFSAQKSQLGATRSVTGGGQQPAGRGLTLVVQPGAADLPKNVDTADKVYRDYTPLPEDLEIDIYIRFDFDSAALRDDQKPRLAALCEAMRSVDVDRFRVIGHTDASGPEGYNEQLSLLRAVEVVRHLTSDCGIDPARLEPMGVGEAFPENPADPLADENRRVEFQAMG